MDYIGIMRKKKFEDVGFWKGQPDCFIIPTVDYSLVCAQFAEIIFAEYSFCLSHNIYQCDESKLIFVTETTKDETGTSIEDRVMLFLPIEIISRYLVKKI